MLRLDVAAQYVEVSVIFGIGMDVDARLYHRLPRPLSPQALFDGLQYFVIGDI